MSRDEAYITVLERAEATERRCAELAAVIDALMRDEYLQKRVASVRQGVGIDTEYGKVILGVLNSGYEKVLAAHDAALRTQVECETLERVKQNISRCGLSAWMVEVINRDIEREFAKGESDDQD